MQLAARHAGMHYNDYVTDARALAEAQLAMADDYGIDCVMTCSDPARELIDIAGDDDSVEWADSGPAIVESRAVLLEKSRLGGLRVPDPMAPGRMRERVESIEIMRQTGGPGASVVGWVEGPLALAAEMRGLSALMLDTYQDPGFLDELLDFTSSVAMAYWKPQVESGADTIGMSDAAASMMSPQHYERFVFPAQLRVVQDIRAHRPDTIIRLHMCGRTDDLLPTMLRLPVDIYELDFPVDLAHAREVLGPDESSSATSTRSRRCSPGRLRRCTRRQPTATASAVRCTSSAPAARWRRRRRRRTCGPWWPTLATTHPTTSPGLSPLGGEEDGVMRNPRGCGSMGTWRGKRPCRSKCPPIRRTEWAPIRSVRCGAACSYWSGRPRWCSASSASSCRCCPRPRSCWWPQPATHGHRPGSTRGCWVSPRWVRSSPSGVDPGRFRLV